MWATLSTELCNCDEDDLDMENPFIISWVYNTLYGIYTCNIWMNMEEYSKPRWVGYAVTRQEILNSITVTSEATS